MYEGSAREDATIETNKDVTDVLIQAGTAAVEDARIELDEGEGFPLPGDVSWEVSFRIDAPDDSGADE